MGKPDDDRAEPLAPVGGNEPGPTRIWRPEPQAASSEVTTSAFEAWADPAPIDPFPDRARSVVGETLNDLYQVRRLIARGGMGEVYEGVEVHTGERVAIKVILPHLAADPKMQQLFLREARALTRLSHPGLVQYRVFANDRKLSVFYIVTQFVDGPPLSDVLPNLKPTIEQILALAERLASALQSAHDAGQIHRDISPDNILLPQGRLEQAKIIDFGITKTVAGANTTIIGGGFAGKLGYVAPEQLSETPDDETPIVGPWTDVYALGLVLLAVIRGQAPGMGRTLTEAVERRKEVPDLAAAPISLRPMLASMLAPDPARRLRSMNDVVAAVNQVRARPAEPKADEARRAPARHSKVPSLTWIIAGSSVAVIAAAAGVVLWLERSTPRENATPGALASVVTVDAAGGSDFTKISDALARAQTGQRIQIKPGRYREPVLIAKDVTLVGTGTGVIIDSGDHRCAELAGSESMTAISFETTATDACLNIQSGKPQLQGISVRASGGVGVRISADANPTIRDLDVERAKGAAIVISDRATGQFERLRITSVDGHGFVAASHSAPIVAGGEISNAQGTGALFVEDARGKLQGVNITRNAFQGVELGDRSAPEITGNTISNNARSGILIRENSLPHIADNTVRGNKAGGVVVTGNSAPNIEANRIEGNLDTGIYLTNHSAGTVSRNQIVSNGSFGIAVDETSQVNVVANELSKNKPPQLVTRPSVQAKFENNLVTP